MLPLEMVTGLEAHENGYDIYIRHIQFHGHR